MAGMELVESMEIAGYQVTVYGHYADETPQGEHICFDVYVLNESAGIHELIDLGEPFDLLPERHEIEALVDELYDADVPAESLREHATAS